VRGRFEQQRTNAGKRGIEWNLTFDQWWSLWEPHWGRRDGTGGLIMCRKQEPGPYSVDNVYIGTQSDNMVDFHRNRMEDNE
jgi:hypothetical protein